MRVVAKRPFYFSTNSLPIHSTFRLPTSDIPLLSAIRKMQHYNAGR